MIEGDLLLHLDIPDVLTPMEAAKIFHIGRSTIYKLLSEERLRSFKIRTKILPQKFSTGQRRQKSESTGLPEKGNKRRAQQMLDKRLDELSQQYTAANSRN